MKKWHGNNNMIIIKTIGKIIIKRGRRRTTFLGGPNNHQNAFSIILEPRRVQCQTRKAYL